MIDYSNFTLALKSFYEISEYQSCEHGMTDMLMTLTDMLMTLDHVQ